MLAYPQDCNKYYSCFNGYAYLQQCPNNLHWSTLTYRCDYPSIANCQLSALPIPADPQIPSTSTLIPSLVGEVVYQAQPNDCSKYFKCQAWACPTNYHWNALTEKCDFPHKARCPFMVGVTDKVIGLKQPAAVGLEANSVNLFTQLYPNDCNKYYQCQAMSCPLNYHWNYRSQHCDLPQLAQCPFKPLMPVEVETTTVSVPTAFTPPPTSAIPTQPNVNGPTECVDCVQMCDGSLNLQYLPHPYDCHKFIQCNGWSFIHTCPDNLFWNAKLNTCDRICVTN